MAIITSTVNNINLNSSFRCTTQITTMYVYLDGSSTSQVDYMTYSTPSTDSENLVFTYSALPADEPIQAVVLSMTGGNSAFGGIVKVNDEFVPKSIDQYIAYLDTSIVGSTSTTITVSFQSYGHTYNHKSDADSSRLISTSTSGNGSEYTETYQYYKSHEGALSLSDITLTIYTGNDSIAVPSTSAVFVGVNGIAKKVTNMFVGVNGVAKKISSAWIGVNGKAKKIFPTFVLGMLSPGDIVKIDEMGDGNLVEWIVMHQNYYGEDQTVLMRKYLLDVGTQRLNYEGGSSSYSNPYFNKTIDNYLTNNWLLSTGYFTFQKMALETTISVKSWSGGNVQSEARKVWLPSAVNISPSSFSSQQDDDPVGGFDYFIANDNNTARKAYLASDLTAAKYWWTRSTTGGTHPYCRAVGDSGSLRNDSYYSGRYLRPVINVSANNFIKIDTDGSYILLYNG